ncbi:hypothetical protein AMD27_12425 [Acinetobacter sp. TGL-Y2]|uniref:tautomerase family protein n=1 Tax=Acinetobacter sp. TGL-Y2 TaxID=1407071 RepID=UPI0007A6581E|nr:tautomerase family protein [Acinetobacter sp. TGL-Y2]AMW79614.1 hypothetical protein AMD27_12425 [Acinetobacter sp. TGL-Y2]
MPHINIKYFEQPLTDDQLLKINEGISQVFLSIFECEAGAISIALEPIKATEWNQKVYIPEILNRANLLHKSPNY